MQQKEKIVTVMAVVELLFGLTLLFFPTFVIRLLFDTDISGVSLQISRLAGISLITFGLSYIRPGFSAMLLYNVLVTLFLSAVGFFSQEVGLLLWPAVALHATVSLLLSYKS